MSSHSSRVERYRYKLNVNAATDTMGVEGTNLTKKDWTEFMYHQPRLESYIRTKPNPDGIVDYEKFIPATQKITFSSLTYFEIMLPHYRMEELLPMTYQDLSPIAQAYSIDVTGRPPEVLIRDIIACQKQKDTQAGVEQSRVPSVNEVVIEKEKRLAADRYEKRKNLL